MNRSLAVQVNALGLYGVALVLAAAFAAQLLLNENATVTVDELRAHLLRFVPKWWLPDAIAFAAELPHGPTGKLQKDELRRRVADGTIVPAGNSSSEARSVS